MCLLILPCPPRPSEFGQTRHAQGLQGAAQVAKGNWMNNALLISQISTAQVFRLLRKLFLGPDMQQDDYDHHVMNLWSSRPELCKLVHGS